MTVRATINTEWDLSAIAVAAGSVDYWVENEDELVCSDVTQEELDDAIATYDHAAAMRPSIRDAISAAMHARIEQGIIWAWSAGGTEYIIELTADMREMLAGWHQLLNQAVPAVNPHGGFIKSNNVIFNGPGNADIPDVAIQEIAEFSGLWVSQISRIAIAEETSVDGMDLATLQLYDVGAIDWTVTWDAQAHPDWSDNLVLYNP